MKVFMLMAGLVALAMAGAAPARAEGAASAQAESAGIAELRRALEGFLVILAIDPESEDILQVRSEPGGVEIVRPLVYIDAEAAYQDWLGGGIPQTYSVVAANAMDVIIETQGAAVWMGQGHDATMAQTRIDQPALFYVTDAAGEPVMHPFESGARMPMFVRHADALRFRDTAKRNMGSGAGSAPELVISHMDMMTTLQAIIRGEIIGVRLVSPEANTRWAEQNRQGMRSLIDYVTDGQVLMQTDEGE
jgi:hypothetical protein